MNVVEAKGKSYGITGSFFFFFCIAEFLKNQSYTFQRVLSYYGLSVNGRERTPGGFPSSVENTVKRNTIKLKGLCGFLHKYLMYYR